MRSPILLRPAARGSCYRSSRLSGARSGALTVTIACFDLERLKGWLRQPKISIRYSLARLLLTFHYDSSC
eukprot:3945390-Pyramimonas_sp.AAC.1